MSMRIPRSLRLALRAAAVAAVILPAAASTASALPTGVCRDPWVTEVITQVTGRAPKGQGEAGECNINLYGAQWSSKDDLRNKVRQAFNAMQNAGVEFYMAEGTVFRDIRMNVNIQASSIYVGPRANAPRRTMYVDLANGYAIAFNRPRCYANSNRGC